MRKIITLFILISAVLLAACSSQQDIYSAYRSKNAETIYHTGVTAYHKGDYETASENFGALDALYPFSPYSQDARLKAIYAYYQAGDNDTALAAADEYIRLYPRSAHVDYAYYMKGIITYNSGLNWFQKIVGVDPSARDVSYMRDSFKTFQQLIHNFPNSQYRTDAELHMIYIRNMLAKHDIRIANFYLKRKAYVAAINRANEVLEEFEGSPSTEDALVVRVKAYRALQMDKLANESLMLLQKNYPDSKQLKEIS